MASIALRIVLLLLLLSAVSAAWNEPKFLWVAGIFFGMLVLTFVRFNFNEKQTSSNTPSEAAAINGEKRSSSDWGVVLYVLIVVTVTYLFIRNSHIDQGRTTIGIVIGIITGVFIFIFLGIIWAIIRSKIESKRFKKYLQSLTPEQRLIAVEQRLKAIDERSGGMLTKLKQSPEYRRALEKSMERTEKCLKPILDMLETPGPLSFSAQNQLEAMIKELEKELQEPTSALRRHEDTPHR